MAQSPPGFIPVSPEAPEERQRRAPTRFEQFFRDPVTGAVESGLGLVLPQGAAETAARFIVPQTPAELGATAALTAVSGPFGRLLAKPLTAALTKIGSRLLPQATKLAQAGLGRGAAVRGGRIGAVTGGGVVGAELGGQDPLSGALQGVLAGTLGESASAVGGLLRRAVSGRSMNILGAERIGELINDLIPSLPRVRTAADFQRVFVEGLGRQAVRKAFQRDVVRGIASRVDRPLVIPEVNKFLNIPENIPMPVDQIIDTIFLRMSPRAFRRGEQIVTTTAQDVGALRRVAIRNLERQLKEINPNLSRMFRNARTEFARGMQLVDALQNRATELFTETGELNVRTLQDIALRRGERLAARGLSPLIREIFRGGEVPARDVPGFIGARVGQTGFPGPGSRGPVLFTSIPTFPKFAGRQPGLPAFPFTLGAIPTVREIGITRQ